MLEGSPSPRIRSMPLTRRLIAAASTVLLTGALAIGAPGAAANAAGPQCDGQNATIVGTGNADYLVGTDNKDVIAGLGGDDTIRGLAGNDVICGGDGDDLINGGLGNDQVFGDAGNDEIQMSDPYIYCSTSTGNFGSVSQAYRSHSDPGFSNCDPANGPATNPVPIPDGKSLSETMDIAIPQGAANLIRDINVRVYINAPKVGGQADPGQIKASTYSPVVKQANSMIGWAAAPTDGSDLTGTSLDSEAVTNIRNAAIGTPAHPVDGRFHPTGSLENKYRNTKVCTNATKKKPANCTWKLTVQDTSLDGHEGSLSWWAIEINYGDATSDGNDTVDCGFSPDDTLDYTARNKAIHASLGDSVTLGTGGQPNETDSYGLDDADRCEWLYSGKGKDVLTGNSAQNDLRGGGGNDKLFGLAAIDQLHGDAGADTLDGGVDLATEDGGAGDDVCNYPVHQPKTPTQPESPANCETVHD
jgi:Ca2+-binding RTX toxin-like protein